MDREILDLIADYVEARAAKRDYQHMWSDELHPPDVDVLADEIVARFRTAR